MTSRSVRLLVVALVTGGLLGGCASFQGEPLGAHYEIEERFRRMNDEDQIGVLVSNGLKTGSLSQDQVKRLSDFLTNLLRESGQFREVLDFTGNPDFGGVDLVVNVSVTKFQVASEQERSQGVRSHLQGEIKVTDPQKENRGSAMVRADGMRLEVVGKNRPPDTVRFFAGAIAELLQ